MYKMNVLISITICQLIKFIITFIIIAYLFYDDDLHYQHHNHNYNNNDNYSNDKSFDSHVTDQGSCLGSIHYIIHYPYLVAPQNF